MHKPNGGVGQAVYSEVGQILGAFLQNRPGPENIRKLTRNCCDFFYSSCVRDYFTSRYGLFSLVHLYNNRPNTDRLLNYRPDSDIFWLTYTILSRTTFQKKLFVERISTANQKLNHVPIAE